MIEVLGGNGIGNAFKALGIKAHMNYRSKHEPYFEVWELDQKKDLKLLEEAQEWPAEFGWYRYAKGSNMGSAYSIFSVNGRELIAWDGNRRDRLMDEWLEMDNVEKAKYRFMFKEYEKEAAPREYDSLLDYIHNEIGVSTESNIIALAVDLARHNGMSVGRLFEVYEG